MKVDSVISSHVFKTEIIDTDYRLDDDYYGIPEKDLEFINELLIDLEQASFPKNIRIHIELIEED